MSYQLKPGQGGLFKNDKKGNEKAPDYRGSANIEGTTYEIAGWIKRQTGKEPFMSLSVKVKEASKAKKSMTIEEVEEVMMADGAPF